MNGGWGISYEIALRWMPLDLTDDKSTLVQVMAWCSQATSHYLSQCWPRSMSPNGITRPKWVKTLMSRPKAHHVTHTYISCFMSYFPHRELDGFWLHTGDVSESCGPVGLLLPDFVHNIFRLLFFNGIIYVSICIFQNFVSGLQMTMISQYWFR